MSIYDPLAGWLDGQAAGRIPARFSDLETILGFTLPASARTYPQWWENDDSHSQVKAWLNSGFHTEEVNIANETVTFAR
jgi:hypothetical protein